MARRTKNDVAWERYFEKTDSFEEIKDNGYFYVTSKDLKNIAEREPRLMAKLDTSRKRPKVFRDNDLTIFPVKNGKYIVFEDPEEKSYFSFKEKLDDLEVEEYDSNVNLNSFDTYPEDQSLSESQAIDFSFVSSLFSNFTQDNNLNLTVRGRLYSDSFSFVLPENNHEVDVSSVQIEVDSGYESDKGVYLVEAKVGKRSNFHIRQLYYPFLQWRNKTEKDVVPIFFTFTNGKYYLTQFSFSENFGELEIIENRCFTINEEPRPKVNITSLVKQEKKRIEPPSDVPYPQANDLDKIVDLVHMIDEGVIEKEEIAEFFDFDERQADYYSNAGIYLGFLRRGNENSSFALTKKGKKFVSLNTRSKRIKYLVEEMTNKKSLNEVLRIFAQNGFDIDRTRSKDIAKIIRKHRRELGQNTAQRRASTIRAWLKWILNNCEVK